MMNNDGALVRRGSSALTKVQEPKEEMITPVADIFETADSYVLKLDMPGASKEGLQVMIDSNVLRVKGIVPSLHTGNVKLVFNEIIRKSYYRAFNLTPGLDTGRISAEFQDGVLTVIIPKAEDRTTKEIHIQ